MNCGDESCQGCAWLTSEKSGNVRVAGYRNNGFSGADCGMSY